LWPFLATPAGTFNLTETTGKVYDFNRKMQGKQGMSIFSLLSPGLYCLLISFSSTAAVDFSRDIQPIFAEYCINCHGNEKPKGGLE